MARIALSSRFTLLALLVLALAALSAPTEARSHSCRVPAHGHHHKHHGHHGNGQHHHHHQPSPPSSSSTDTKGGSDQSTPTTAGGQTSSGSDHSSGSDDSTSSSSGSDNDSTNGNQSSGSAAGGKDTPPASNSGDSTTPATGNTGGSKKSVVPGCKAGVAGGQSLKWTESALCWMTDWTPKPTNNQYLGNLKIASMLWGLGRTGHDGDTKRFEAFKQLKPGSMEYVIGFNEADFEGEGSSGVIPPTDAAAAWDQWIAPHGEAGAVLVSPSCAKQKDETWLKPFLAAVKRQPDAINVHIFANSIDGAKRTLEHFAQYGKPMWITEFQCIDYSVSPTVYCSQQQTDDFITQAIKLFEADDRVAAYAISDAYNGPNSALTPNHSGSSLSQTGKVFLAAVQSASKKTKRSLDRIAARRA